MSPIKGLMTGLIDYAGLFPPAGLGMDEAVRRYAEYRAGGHAPALGRFIIPAGRLAELRDSILPVAGRVPAPAWPLSIIVGEKPEAALAGVARFEEEVAAGVEGSWARISSLEHRVSRPEQVGERLHLVQERLRESESVEVFFEIPLGPDPDLFVAAIASPGAGPVPEGEGTGRPSTFAKIRTGGVTSEAFPAPEAILRFLVCCRDHGVAFKATAGLHHPLCGLYPLTYEEHSDLGAMTGFLNLFLTASAVHRRIGQKEEWLALLTEASADAFTFSGASIRWRSLTLPTSDIVATRHEFARSFGSCSFEEPIEGLRELAVSCKET